MAYTTMKSEKPMYGTKEKFVFKPVSDASISHGTCLSKKIVQTARDHVESSISVAIYLAKKSVASCTRNMNHSAATS